MKWPLSVLETVQCFGIAFGIVAMLFLAYFIALQQFTLSLTVGGVTETKTILFEPDPLTKAVELLIIGFATTTLASTLATILSRVE